MSVICIISCKFLSFIKKILSFVIKSFFTFATNDNHFTTIIGILQHKMYSCFELSWNSKYILALTHWQLTTFNVFKVQEQVLLSLNPKPKQNHKYVSLLMHARYHERYPRPQLNQVFSFICYLVVLEGIIGIWYNL